MNKTTQTSEMENQKEEKKIVNGVSVTNLFQMVETIKNNSDIADFNFRAKGRWINGEYNITTINDFPQILVKPTTEVNPLDLKKMNHCTLRRRQGANPVESTLATLNGCLTTSLIYHAAAQGVKIVEVETTLSGDLDLHGFLGMDENVRNGYEKLQVNFSIKSDASEDKLKELGG